MKKTQKSSRISGGFLFAKNTETNIIYVNIILLMNPLELPKLTKHVTDFSWILTSAQIESFSKQLAEHETKTTEQVTVVLFPHREWHELIDIWLKIFNENGIGQKNLNNWLLLIVATEEKKIRIITGKWMEIKYSEMRCRDIIENQLRPLLNRDAYGELIQSWISEIFPQKNPEDSNNMATVSGKEQKENALSIGIIFWVVNTLYLFMITGFLWALFGIGLSILMFLLLRYLRKIWKISTLIYPWLLIGPWLALFISIIAILTPADCKKVDAYIDTWTNDVYRQIVIPADESGKYTCERNIFGYTYEFSYSIGGSSSNSNGFGWSSSSSFGGGGGSSNGGGGGD